MKCHLYKQKTAAGLAAENTSVVARPRDTRPRRSTRIVVGCLIALVCGSAVLSVGPADRSAAGGAESGSEVACRTPAVADEPPCNPALVDSPWGASHRGSYAQASSPWPGPAPDDDVEARHADLPGVPIQLQFSSPYADGGVAVWGSLVNTDDSRGVVKLDHDTGEVIDVYLPSERETEPPPATGTGGISGAYNLLDRDGRFIVARERAMEVYGDTTPGDRRSPIELITRFDLPDSAFCRADDRLVGTTMTYDGMVAFATELGTVGVVPREPDRMVPAEVVALSLAGDDCRDETRAVEELETVSNSIAVDEAGGIYVVTSAAMHRVDWNDAGGTLEVAWSAAYETGSGRDGIRLGAGSGSTPSLMGTGADDDRLVVITDARELMHVVLFWRDEIPDGWEPVRPGADPRVACEAPVTFGDPSAASTVSEQSVLVRGRATIHVNNQLVDDSVIEGLTPDLASALAALEGGDPAQAPRGIERIDWDPVTRTCASVWANPELSIPNGIPTMSATSGFVYGVGQRDGTWGIEAVDFATGSPAAWFPARNLPCTPDALAGAAPLQRASLEAVLQRLPNSCENSVYAATEIGPGGSLWTGTLFGVTSHLPASPLPPPPFDAETPGAQPESEPEPVPDDDDADQDADGGRSPVIIGLIVGVLLLAVVALVWFGRNRGPHGRDS